MQRPRRQKKPSKEAKQGKLLRRDEGSRFGVLAEEGNGVVGKHIAMGQLVDQDVAVEVNIPQLPTLEKQIRERKAETKKKQKKELI